MTTATSAPANPAAPKSLLRRATTNMFMLAIAALVLGFGVTFTISAIASDPCLDDWDIVCTSTSGDRLSIVQGIMLPVMLLGYLAFVCSAILGILLAVQTGTRAVRTRAAL